MKNETFIKEIYEPYNEAYALLKMIKDCCHNRLLYHNRSEDTESKINKLLRDAQLIISACGNNYDDYSEYQLLIRVINEQTTKDSSPIQENNNGNGWWLLWLRKCISGT